MSKILVVGVGSAGVNTIARMKEIGIPEADYAAIDCYGMEKIAKEHGIPHYNLLRMNGIQAMSNTGKPEVFARLAEDVKEQIKTILETNLNRK